MKAREPKLKLPQFDTLSIDVCHFIRMECSNYLEAADFFGVSEPTIKRWMSGTCSPSPLAVRVIYYYEQIKEVN